MPSIDLPTVPLIPTITKDTTLPPVRGYVDYNPTPTNWQKNPLFVGPNEPDANGQYAFTRVSDDVEYAKRLGFTPAFMVYDQTMNYSPIWATATPDKTNRFNLDWSKTMTGGINDAECVKTVAELALRPRKYGADLRPYRPVFIDIEDEKNPAQDKTSVVQQFRQTLGNDAELYWYDDPGVPGQSGICMNLYNWNLPSESPEQWFSAVDRATEKYPGPNKVAVIQPRYQYFWSQQPIDPKSPKQDQYLDLDLWKRQVRYLVSRQWSLFLWAMGPLKQSHAHIEYAAKFIV